MAKKYGIEGYVLKNSVYFHPDVLIAIYPVIDALYQNAMEQTKRVAKWLQLYGIDSTKITFEQLNDLIQKDYARKESLKAEGKSPSIVDISLYRIYAPDEESAIREWNNNKGIKSKKSIQWNSENPGATDSGSLEACIRRYGSVDGPVKYEEYRNKKIRVSKRRVEYWMEFEGMTEDEAKEAVGQHQRFFSKEICIQKHGEVDGLKIWKDRQDKWQNTLKSKSEEEKLVMNLKKNGFSIEGVMLRGYSLEEAEKIVGENYQRNKGWVGGRNFSKEATDFIEKNIENKNDCLYGENEWFIYSKETKKHYFYDFTNLSKKVIFEYHGHAFHPNSKLMTESDLKSWRHPYSKEDAYTVMERDIQKKRTAEKDGFLFFQIYSNDSDELKRSIIDQINLALQ